MPYFRRYSPRRFQLLRPSRSLGYRNPRTINAHPGILRRTQTVRIPRNISRRAFHVGNLRTKGVLRPEMHLFEIAETSKVLTTTLASVTTAPLALNVPAQGTTKTTRVGNRIIVKSVFVRGKLSFLGFLGAGGLNTRSNRARIIIIIDHQCNGLLPVAADILETPTLLDSFRDTDNSTRFTVLLDKVYTSHPQVVQDSAGNYASFDRIINFAFYKRLNMLCRFDGTTADIANLTDNSITIFAMINKTLAACTFTFTTRMRFASN